MEQERYQEAKAHFNSIQNFNDLQAFEIFLVHYNYGFISYHEGNYEKAISSFERAKQSWAQFSGNVNDKWHLTSILFT